MDWSDLVLRREGRKFSFWPCTETKGSFFFTLTLYWDERVVFFHFDLVLRREGCKFWIEVTLYWDERVVFFSFWPCTETWGSLFFILTLYWDERVVVLDFDLVGRCMFDAWKCMNFSFCLFFLKNAFTNVWNVIFLRMHVKIHEICLNVNFWFYSFWKMNIRMHEIWFFCCIYECIKFLLNMNFENAFLNAWNLIFLFFFYGAFIKEWNFY